MKSFRPRVDARGLEMARACRYMRPVMTQHFKITLPDGSVREVEPGTTPADIAAAIGPGLAKAALAARVNGEVRDLNRPLEGDAELALITARDEADALELVRHDYAHVLAEAVQNLFPGTQITFGPATEDGFYYDFAPTPERGPFTEEDLPAIEEEMRRIIARDEPLVREVWTRDEVRAFFEKQGESFKAEWVMELPADETITMYRSGGWIDLCRGPHLASTGKVDPQAFKLTRVSGAYWRGDQKNAMLSRIYGTGWLNRKQLDAHLVRLEEAAKRDHRRIGQEMDLFHLQAEAQGSVFWHPKGFVVWRALEAYMRRRLDAAGYRGGEDAAADGRPPVGAVRPLGQVSREHVRRPRRGPEHRGGRAGAVAGEGDLMALKPMNCPAHVQIFSQGIKSYRDLPIRLAEFGCCHRNEPHGALHGIMRVRQFTQDDAHIFCREDQVVEEMRRFCDLLDARLSRPRLRRLCDQARAAARAALRLRRDVGQGRAGAARRGRSGRPRHGRIWLGGAARRGRLLRAQARIPSDATRSAGPGRCGTLQLDYGAARAARRDLCRRGRRSGTGRSCSTARSSARSSASSAS